MELTTTRRELIGCTMCGWWVSAEETTLLLRSYGARSSLSRTSDIHPNCDVGLAALHNIKGLQIGCPPLHVPKTQTELICPRHTIVRSTGQSKTSYRAVDHTQLLQVFLAMESL